MQILAQLFVMMLCLLMFRVKRENKLAILFLATVCLDAVTVSFIPFGNAKYILPICFFLSEMPNLVSNYRKMRKTILSSLMLAMILATIILIITSPHYNSLMQYARMIIMELLAKYFIICYAFMSLKGDKQLKSTLNVVYYGLLVLTAFAIVNQITKHAIFIGAMLQGVHFDDFGQDFGAKFIYSDRFRVQAMFVNPFDYGYICIMLLLLNIYSFTKHLITRKRLYIIILCCLFGIFTSGSRTILLCAIIGAVSYMFFAFALKRKVRYALVFFSITMLSYSLIPFVQDKIEEMTTMFDKNSDVNGSSLSMRELQYAAVVFNVKDHIIFGRGKDFFLIDMGWKDGVSGLVDKDLMGLEGIIMSLLLERGILGVLFYLFFYITLLCFAYKCRKYDKATSAFGLSVLLTYLGFANMTGELSSVFPTLLIVGVCIRLLYNSKSEKTVIFK